jgi:poly(A) polymerase
VLERLPPDPLLRLAVLAREPSAMKERWRLSNHEGRRLQAISSLVPPSPALRDLERKIVLYQIGPEAWRDVVQLAWARSGAPAGDAAWQDLLELPERWEIPKLPVSGNDLVAAGMNPGPEIGVTLRRLEDWWVASGFTPGKQDLLGRLT